MLPTARQPARSIGLTAPVVLLILAATAIPVELRPLGPVPFGVSVYWSDVFANIAGYFPLGALLARLGIVRAVAAASLLSALAECSQLWSVHRDPSLVDLAANMLGAALGSLFNTRFRLFWVELPANRVTGAVAGVLAVVLTASLWVCSAPPMNLRGLRSPGVLEAHWRLDEHSAGMAVDCQGQGLNGHFVGEPKPVSGVLGGAIQFNGKTDYITFGPAVAFRLVGGMTIAAWINSSRFPPDDAAIVSTLKGGFGYQLDTTIDRGQRAVAFKLTNACGVMMARYGATTLEENKWYHVAGVYDDEALVIHVYLNGRLDDGYAVGSVTCTQHPSRSALYIARRPDLRGAEFAGFIDDVRIYSHPLTRSEVSSVMREGPAASPGELKETSTRPRSACDAAVKHDSVPPGRSCTIVSEPEDVRIPVMAAAIGVLMALSVFGWWPAAPWPLALGLSLVGGCICMRVIAWSTTSLVPWFVPVAAMMGASAVVSSLRRADFPTSS